MSTVLPRIGLGMAALGRPGYITLGHGEDFEEARSLPSMRSRAFAVLDAAYDSGVRYFDAARSYGEAEAFLSAWLSSRRVSPEQVRVGSKWGYTYTADWQVSAAQHEVKDHSLSALQRQYPESRALLSTHLSLYQIHSATPESRVLADDAVLDALARIRDAGVRVGLSVSGVSQAATIYSALKIERGGERLFSSVQATWNLLERSCEDALQEAHDRGLCVLVKEALANGRLTARGELAALAPLQEVAGQLGASPDAVALGAALAAPWADVVLLGAVNPLQLSENLAATRLSLQDHALSALSMLREAPASYWAFRARLPWQ